MDKNDLKQNLLARFRASREIAGSTSDGAPANTLKFSDRQSLWNRGLVLLRGTELNSKRQLVHDSEWCLMLWCIGVTSLLLLPQLPSLNFWLIVIAALALLSYSIEHVRYVLVLVCAMFWASWNFQHHWSTTLPFELESKSFVVQGYVADLPRINSSRSRFRFHVKQASSLDSGFSDPAEVLHGEMIELSCYRCRYNILPQQEWRFTVRLKRPHGYASWGAFDFEKYLFRHQLIARGYIRLKEENQFISDGRWSINNVRWRIKQQLSEQLSDYTVGHGMIAALLIGDKSQLKEQHKRTFQTTGISHLMAISGLHVGLVFLFTCQLIKWLLMPFASVFYRCPRQFIVLPPALMAALLYSAMAGFAVSTQRAFIMLTVFVICRLVARELDLLRVLLVAASLILLIDPFSILDVGFWLSCGAVFIIAIAALRIKILKLYKLQPLLWLGMLPMSMGFFGQVSLISPFVNLLMVPLFCSLVIPVLLLILAMSELGFALPYQLIIHPLVKLLERIYALLEGLSDLKWALIYPSFSNLCVVLLLLFAAHSIWRKLRTRQLLMAIGLACLGCYSIIYNDNYRAKEVEIALLDVGQGLSMVVRVNDYVLVYDTGPAYPSGFNAAEAVLIPYLRDQGISEINTLIISHADNDHIGGYSVFSNTFKIHEVLTSRVDRIPQADLCQAGQRWNIEEIEFEIISPQKDTPQGSNNLSCVLSISNGVFRALLTGDIEKQVERFLLANRIDLKADFLLVPHQGSKTSSTAKFIDAVEPIIGFIAAGYRNHYGHPHPSVVDRYTARSIKLMSTVENGSILLKFNDKNFEINSFRKQEKRFWHRQKIPN